MVIVRKLDGRQQYVSGEELQEYVRNDMEMRGTVAGYSLRTIQRDIVMIEELFGIIIQHEHGLGYHIADREMASSDRYEELLMNLDILSALNTDSGLSDFVFTEHHKTSGGELMPYLLRAIRNSNFVEFDYKLVRHDDRISHKRIEPYFLKECLHRWYIIGKDEAQLKVFGLDRISNLLISENSMFQRDETINPIELFRDSFGIWNDYEMPVEDIILSYSPLDGSFLKSLPLHHSQETLADDSTEFRIRVRLRITNDFVMELLSRSNSLKVIAPESLRERIRGIYKDALKRNTD